MSIEPIDLYFKSQGWPTMLDGKLARIADLTHDELVKIARLYAVALQIEFRQIRVPPKPDDAPVRLMQAHSPMALAGVYYTEAAEMSARQFAALKDFKPRVPRAKRGHGPRGKRK